MLDTSMPQTSGALPTVPATRSAQLTSPERNWAPLRPTAPIDISEREKLSLKARMRFTWRITDKGCAPTTTDCRMADTIANPFSWVERKKKLIDAWAWPIQSNWILR